MFKPHLALALLLATGSSFAAPLHYQIDPAHTDVIASWTHMGFSHPSAHFGQAQGTIIYDAGNPAASSVNVSLPLTGLNSHVEALDKHMRSSDMFDAQRFGSITFKSTRVQALDKQHLRVHGLLTLHGITKSVVLDTYLNGAGVHPMAKRNAIGFDATTTIKRSEFGITYALPAVSDAINIRITTEALVPETK